MRQEEINVTDDQVRCFTLFGSILPSFVFVPHIILPSSAIVAKEIGEVTKSKPAPWPEDPPYDETGMEAESESPPLSDWANPYNQAHFLRLCGEMVGHFYGNER